MVQIDVTYEGQLHCRVVHAPSGHTFNTDAPLDNHGKGEMISPTDLVGASLASCILTVMAIAANRHGIELKGSSATVTKQMSADPPRRIAALDVQVTLPHGLPASQRGFLEDVGRSCPVDHSLHPDIAVSITFNWVG